MRTRHKKLRHGPARSLRRDEAVRESEKKFRDLAEKALVGVYLIQDGAFQYVNPKLAEIFGYPVHAFAETVRPEHVVFKEDWPLVNENIRKRIAGEVESIHSEFRGITKEGGIIHVEVYGSRTTYRGRPALIGTLLDVTQRKEAEELLRRAEQKYRSIYENAVEGIFQSTPEGKLISVNPAFAEMLGYSSSAELLGIVTDIGRQFYVRPEVRLEFMESIEKKGFLKGFECEVYRKDGTRIWVSMNARRVVEGKGDVVYYEGTMVDITERRKAEEELNRLNEFNKVIIDNTPVAIFTIDRNGKFMSVNPALATLSGLGSRAEEKLLGFNWLENPYTVRCGLADYIRRGLEGKPFQLWDFAFMNYRGDKNIFMDFRGVPLRGKDGNIEGLLCIIEETTDRVMARARLMQEAKMAAIGRLAAGVAHELNNPLGTLVAYAERASNYLQSMDVEHIKGDELEKVRGYLKIIDEEAFRCKRVVSDILNIPRMEGMEIARVDVERLLDDIVETLSRANPEVNFIREAEIALPPIEGDRSVIRQIFVNLVQNAIDAVESTKDPKIWIRTGMDGEGISIEVEDNGIGIPEGIIEKIFEPFFTTKESKKGVGLGLALCHDFVRNMGGRITVKSKPGLGTRFSLVFPVQGKSGKAQEQTV